MAKVQVNYDTETKELSLNIDGVEHPNIISAEFYSEGTQEKYGFFSARFQNIKENGVIYSLRAEGSKIEKSDPIENFARQVLTKNKK